LAVAKLTYKKERRPGAEKERAPRERGSKAGKPMNNTKNASMLTIYFSMGQGKNHYSVTSAAAILKNLEKFHKITIQRRWLFYALRWLEDEGYIRRKERYRNDEAGLISQIPSMITFTLKGMVWLVSKGVVGAKKLYKGMMKYLKKQDNRWPSRSEFDDGSYKPADPEERARLNDLLTGSTKDMNKLWD